MQKHKKAISPRILAMDKAPGVKFHIMRKENFPHYDMRNAMVHAYATRNGKHVYLDKGHSSKYYKAHETYHAIKKSGESNNPMVMLRAEIEADLYAYKKTGVPKYNYRRLEALLKDAYLADERFDIQYSDGLRMIGQVLNEYDVPETWHECYGKLKDNYRGKKFLQWKYRSYDKMGNLIDLSKRK